jgi:hypothetical protein
MFVLVLLIGESSSHELSQEQYRSGRKKQPTHIEDLASIQTAIVIGNVLISLSQLTIFEHLSLSLRIVLF